MILSELFTQFPALEEWYNTLEGSVSNAITHEHQAGNRSRISKSLSGHMENLTRKLMGEASSQNLRAALDTSSNILMAHHHGICCHPEFIQSAIMFSLPMLVAEEKSSIPILACSSVALRSFSFPRGLLLGRQTSPGNLFRLPFFSSSLGDLMVSDAPPLQEKQLKNVLQQWNTLNLKKEEKDSAVQLVEEHILNDNVLSLPTFSDQATLINASFWQQLCGPQAPELIFLDMEAIVTALLLDALNDSSSLFYNLLLDEECRNAIYDKLAGLSGCWPELGMPSGPPAEQAGTAFFWLSDKGRRRKLQLQKTPTPCLMGKNTCIPLEKEALIEGLETKKLVPGLFISCMLLSYEHGLTPHGGIFMSEYFPQMFAGLNEITLKYGLTKALEPAKPMMQPCLATAFIPYRMAENRAWAASALELLSADKPLASSLPTIAEMPAKKACLSAFADWWLENKHNAPLSPEKKGEFEQMLSAATCLII